MEYLRRNTSGLSLNSANEKKQLENRYSWVVKIVNTVEAVRGGSTPATIHPSAAILSLGKYCGPHTASSVFLILVGLYLRNGDQETMLIMSITHQALSKNEFHCDC